MTSQRKTSGGEEEGAQRATTRATTRAAVRVTTQITPRAAYSRGSLRPQSEPDSPGNRASRSAATKQVTADGTPDTSAFMQATNEARYRALVEVAGQIVWTTSATGVVNDGQGGMAGWCAFTGQSPHEVTGWGWLDAVHPDMRGQVARAWARAIAGRERYEAEYRLRRHDGAYRDFAVHGVPVLNADGAVREWVGICVDITESKRAEAERDAVLARERATSRHLRALQDVTETALAHLALDDLMPCLLDRVLEALDADHATILLLDDDAQSLSVRAERGIAIDNTMRIRTPLGRGIAGQIAVRREPRVIEDLATVEVVNPAVRERLRSLVGVPLLLDDAVMGVVVVATVTTRRFTADDIRLLERAAERVGLALGQARQYEAERRAREEAAARAAQLAAMIESMADGVIVHDAEGRTLHANTAARRLLGLDATPEVAAAGGTGRWTLRDARGRALSEDRMPLFRVLRGETLTGPNAVDVTLTMHDGREVELSLSAAPVVDESRGEGRQVAGGVLIFRDVTERRHLERRTAESLRALLAMAETLVSPEGDGTVDEANPDAGPIAVDNGQDSIGQDSVARLAELTRSVLGCQRVAMLSLDADAREVAVRAASGVAASVADTQLASFALFSLVSRLTDAQLARLRAGEPLLVGLAPISALDAQVDEAEISAAQISAAQISAAQISAAQISAAQISAAQISAETAIPRVLVAPLRLRGALVGVLVIDDAEAGHTYTAQEIALAAGVAQLAALVIERERLLREHAEAQANELALRAANRQMDDFLSMASHELRTPLTSVKAYIQVAQRRLRQGLPDAAQETAETTPAELAAHLANQIAAAQVPLERANAHSDVLNRLVGDLLDASRIQARRLDMRMAPCDLAALSREVIEEQQLAWPERVILAEDTLAEETTDKPGMTVYGDAARLKQVIGNYLTNAIKYAPADQPIAVGLEAMDEHARVYVRDHGPGLPLEEQRRIWDRFHRSAGVRAQNGTESGLGLGLYICRGIIELHGGTVGVASTPGHGSTFSFALPRLSAPAP